MLKHNSTLVAAGIFLSRVSGLIRETVFAAFFGTSMAGDAFKAAFRIPNLLQNLLGEGVLSASFIPRYSALLRSGQQADADKVAGAVFSILSLAISIIVLLGVLTAPWFVPFITSGFSGERLELTIKITQILFPGAGLLVLSAWCLGVLNSHRKFFLSYVAPVAWNAAMIATLFLYQGNAEALAWGSVAGSVLQFVVQIPMLAKLAPGIRPNMMFQDENVRVVFRNFGPNFVSRGVVQISAFIDLMIASRLPVGAVAALSYAQALYLLPISLFGMSVSAAELPEMAGSTNEHIRDRLKSGTRRILMFVVPSALGLLVFGGLIASILFQRREFTQADTVWVWQILAAASIGLPATTVGRLYSSAFYAIGDTRTPLKYAVVRIVLSMILGYTLAVIVPPAFGIDPKLGAAGLTLAASVSGWLEFWLLRRRINAIIGV